MRVHLLTTAADRAVEEGRLGCPLQNVWLALAFGNDASIQLSPVLLPPSHEG